MGENKNTEKVNKYATIEEGKQHYLKLQREQNLAQNFWYEEDIEELKKENQQNDDLNDDQN